MHDAGCEHHSSATGLTSLVPGGGSSLTGAARGPGGGPAAAGGGAGGSACGAVMSAPSWSLSGTALASPPVSTSAGIFGQASPCTAVIATAVASLAFFIPHQPSTVTSTADTATMNSVNR